MNAPLFISILRKSLIPFIEEILLDGHCMVEDNDPNIVQSWLVSSAKMKGSTGG